VKALQKKPDDRFASAEEFRHAIDDALRESGHYFRQSEVRRLMESLFSDVQERQREVLDECLAAAAAMEPQPDPSTASRKREQHSPDAFDGGSESDLEIPNLGLGYEGETTTPSSALRSPLVTAEDEDRVAVEEKGPPRKERTPTPLPQEAAQAATVAELPTPELAEATAEPTLQVGDDERPWLRIAAALAAILLIAVLGVFWATGAFTPEPSPSVVSVQTHTEAVPAPSPDEPSAQDPPAAPVETPSPTSVDAPTPAPNDRVTKPERRRRTRPTKTRPRRDKSRADDKVATPAPTPTPPPDKPPDVAPKQTARLTLETVPWTTVYLGGKKLGETPIINVAIPAGEVTLTLVNPGKNIRQDYFLKAAPGKTYRKRLKLD
jgi:hypothetical protein